MNRTESDRVAEVSGELQRWFDSEFREICTSSARQNLDPDDIAGALLPWIEDIKGALEGGLSRSSPEVAAGLRLTLNRILDKFQASSELRGLRFADMLARFDGIEDILVGMKLAAGGWGVPQDVCPVCSDLIDHMNTRTILR